MVYSSPESIEAQSARVLVADDETSIRELLRLHLARAGYEVLIAADGEEAIEIALAERPDIILVDLFMPGLDGYGVCSRLKDEVETADIPIVMISAAGNPQDRVQALELGVDDFINKPFDRIELLARVRSLLRVKRLYRSLTESNTELQQAYAAALDAETRYRSLVGDAMDAIFVIDPDGSVIREANASACGLVGIDAPSMMGRAFIEFCCGAPTEVTDKPVETELTRANGAVVPVLVKVSLIRAVTSNLLQYTIRDLTSVRLLQQERLHTERLAAIVETAVTVNEEVNTPLSVIIGSAESIRADLGSGEMKTATRIQHILDASQQIQDVVAQLTHIQRPVSKEYLPGTLMLDLEQSTATPEEESNSAQG